jgi:hypothetical protein
MSKKQINMEQENYENVLTMHDETIVRAITTMQKASRKAEILLSEYRPILRGERLLTDAELADLLKVSRRTLQEYRNDRILPYIRMKGNILYKESDIEKVLKTHEHKSM